MIRAKQGDRHPSLQHTCNKGKYGNSPPKRTWIIVSPRERHSDQPPSPGLERVVCRILGRMTNPRAKGAMMIISRPGARSVCPMLATIPLANFVDVDGALHGVLPLGTVAHWEQMVALRLIASLNHLPQLQHTHSALRLHRQYRLGQQLARLDTRSRPLCQYGSCLEYKKLRK